MSAVEAGVGGGRLAAPSASASADLVLRGGPAATAAAAQHRAGVQGEKEREIHMMEELLSEK